MLIRDQVLYRLFFIRFSSSTSSSSFWFVYLYCSSVFSCARVFVCVSSVFILFFIVSSIHCVPYSTFGCCSMRQRGKKIYYLSREALIQCSTLYLFLFFFCFIVCVCVHLCGSFMEYNDRVEMRISWEKRRDTKRETEREKNIQHQRLCTVKWHFSSIHAWHTSIPSILFLLSLFFFVVAFFSFVPLFLDIWSVDRSVWMEK